MLSKRPNCSKVYTGGFEVENSIRYIPKLLESITEKVIKQAKEKLSRITVGIMKQVVE